MSRKTQCAKPAVVSRSVSRKAGAYGDSTVGRPGPDRKDGHRVCWQPTFGVLAARQELTMLATVGKQCSRPQGRVHMCRPSTTRTTPQGEGQAVSTGSLENQPRGSVMGADSLVAVYSDSAIHSRSGPRNGLPERVPHAHPVCRPQGRCEGSASVERRASARVGTAVIVPAELKSYGAALRSRSSRRNRTASRFTAGLPTVAWCTCSPDRKVR